MPNYDWCQTKKEEDDMQPEVHGFFHADTNTISYVVKDPGSNACAVIDSVLDYDPAAGRTSTVFADQIVGYVESRKLKVEWILETHAHADHLSAAPYIKQRLGGKTAIGANITTVQNVFGKVFNAGPEFRRDGSQFDALLSDGDEVLVGGLRGRVMYTPGHTPACITYVFGDAAFIGDTLFMPDYGTARCDFPGG
ncbi:MAG TPA: MBL fold metallo-hydrolase, partial [Methylocella sp.]|nr:MBL fold metallo-hydrolase [Methylocella sp.]